MRAAAHVQVSLRVGTGLTLEAPALFLPGVEAPGSPSVVPPTDGAPLPPVRTGDTAAGPPPSPHDAGHLLQQQTVIPVDDGQPALLQLHRHTGRARAAPGPPRAQPCPGGLQPRPGPRGPLAPARAAAAAPWAAGGLLCPNWDTRGRGQISQTWSGSNREGEAILCEIRSFLKTSELCQ